MTFRRLLLATATMLAPCLAQAQTAPPAPSRLVDGVYIGGGAGVNSWRDQTSNGYRLHDEDWGYAVVGAIGYGFGNGLRIEAEGNYRGSSVNAFDYRNVKAGSSGDIRTYGAMANLFYDLDTGTAFTPYIGGGVGYAWSELKGIRGTYNGTSLKIDDTQANLAWQGIAGLAYDLGGGLALTAEYRYFAMSDSSYGVARTGGNVAAVSHTMKVAPENHSGLIGLRYAFNATPAAALVAAPVAAPVAARSYLVFFDWNKATLSERARQIIAEAAEGSRKAATTRIDVNGYTDRSGTPQANMALSRRRAEAVAAELVGKGVPKGEIAITAFGETNPLVPTADGAREPQNRRVEIILK